LCSGQPLPTVTNARLGDESHILANSGRATKFAELEIPTVEFDDGLAGAMLGGPGNGVQISQWYEPEGEILSRLLRMPLTGRTIGRRWVRLSRVRQGSWGMGDTGFERVTPSVSS
jgi:hypothetical protein